MERVYALNRKGRDVTTRGEAIIMYPLIDLESRSTNMHGKKGIDRIYDCSDRTLHAFLDRDSLTGKGGEPPMPLLASSRFKIWDLCL
jgi:hypothetical protein